MTFRGGLVAGLLNIGEQGMSQVRGWCYKWCLAIDVYWQVLPCLYIGSQKDAQDLGQINRFRISHVVSAHQGAAKQFKVKWFILLQETFQSIEDMTYQSLINYIYEISWFSILKGLPYHTLPVSYNLKLFCLIHLTNVLILPPIQDLTSLSKTMLTIAWLNTNHTLCVNHETHTGADLPPPHCLRQSLPEPDKIHIRGN